MREKLVTPNYIDMVLPPPPLHGFKNSYWRCKLNEVNSRLEDLRGTVGPLMI